MNARAAARQYVVQAISCLDHARRKAGHFTPAEGMTNEQIVAQLDALHAVAVDAVEQIDAAREAMR